MDRALDEVIGERHDTENRGGRNRRRNNWTRDSARKNNARDDNNIDTDWLHDKYEDDPESRRPTRGPRGRRNQDRYSPEADLIPQQNAKLRVDNLHYDLTEDDLDDLFTRIAPITSLSLRFDRAGRSTGTAFVSYASVTSARAAIREFDGANANGQPIRLTLLPTPNANRPAATRNPFDYAIKPSRSLFDRIEEPRDSRDRGRDRSRSPGAPRRSDVRKPPPEGVDRYVPGGEGGRLSRSRSPVRRRGRGGRDGGDRGREAGRREEGRMMVGGRPRMTQEELDKEMEDYWGSKGEANGAAANGNVGEAAAAPAAVGMDEDIDMVT